jgi:hypothetical protein
MDYKKKYQEFNKRFGIAEPEVEPKEEFIKFRQRILNIFSGVDFKITSDGIKRFCTWRAIQIRRRGDSIQAAGNIYNELGATVGEKDFFFLIETIFSLYPGYAESGHQDSQQKLYKAVAEAFAISDISASITVIKDKDRSWIGEVLVYPRGEAILDKELVEEVFRYLNKASQSHLVAAIKSYKAGKKSDHVKSAESIRRCLEEFLRYKFENKKGLDSNIKVLLDKLKIVKAASEIKSIIHQVTKYLDDYFNEHSKHGDGDIGEAENEFLLYQAGLLMRYISKVI